MTERQWLVFTDLDGTLLDHTTYQYAAAQPALDQLAQCNIPVILNSSKTRAEMTQLQQDIGLQAPFIVENGAAIVLPPELPWLDNTGAEIMMLAEPRAQLLAVLADARQAGFQFRGFADMTPQDIAECTGLTPERAKLAAERLATEPLQWRDDESKLPQFEALLAQAGLRMVQGGRFLHVMGHFDKADAMRQLTARYRQAHPQFDWQTIALGDSPNDEAMLNSADIAVVVKGVNSAKVSVSTAGAVHHTDAAGPVGWNATMLSLLANAAAD